MWVQTMSRALDAEQTGITYGEQHTARPLLTPGEVMQLTPDEAVVMVSSVAPIKAKKLRYYADANFKRRVLPPPAHPRQAGRC